MFIAGRDNQIPSKPQRRETGERESRKVGKGR